jgi:Ca2+-binding EF-hand superfamily protein
MMISMVDTDGDGQVGYGEFYMMVTDEDPARPDFGKSDDTAANRPEDAAKSFERQREMAARDLKRRMLTQFVSENQIGPTEVGFAWEKYTHQPPERIEGGVIDFELFCELLQVEPTGEYHKLFGLFDGDGSGDVDIKEFILGLCNFVDMDNDKKCRFIFELFDDDHSGFLAMSELEEILMANHMQSRKACQRKAQTIMRAADIDGSGAISLAEFIVCSAKFPNILFPNQRE